MLNKIERLTDVKSFILLNKTLFLSRTNKVYKYLNGDCIDILDADETLQNLRCSDGNIFINTNFGKGYYINNDVSICIIDPIQHISFPFFLSYERTENSKKTVIKNIEDKNFKNYIFGSSTIFTFSNNKYFRWNYQLKIIEAFEFPTAQPLWNFDLSSLGEFINERDVKFAYEVESFLGVVDNNLLVLLKQREILVIDINSGTIKQRLQKADFFEGETVITDQPDDHFPLYVTHYFIQPESNIICAFFVDLLFEISYHHNTFKVNTYGLKRELEQHHVNPEKISRNTFYFEGKIYFLEQEFGRFGILNVGTKKIEYVSEAIEINGQGIGFDKLKEIQATCDKVYVLDKTNTLHIFQKT